MVRKRGREMDRGDTKIPPPSAIAQSEPMAVSGLC